MQTLFSAVLTVVFSAMAASVTVAMIDMVGRNLG